MPILLIDEIINPNKENLKPIKEKQDIMIPNIIDKNIPRRNGSIVIFTGSGGSGKTSMLLNMFKSKKNSIEENLIIFITFARLLQLVYFQSPI